MAEKVAVFEDLLNVHRLFFACLFFNNTFFLVPADFYIAICQFRQIDSLAQSQSSLCSILISHKCQTCFKLWTIDQFEADYFAKSCKDPSIDLLSVIYFRQIRDI